MEKHKYNPDASKKKQLENETQAKELLKYTLDNFQDNPALIAEAFQFSSNFYEYSPKNMLLIYAQNKGATYCQSYAAWKKQGYHVRKESEGLKIWVKVETTLLRIGEHQYVALSKATNKQKEAYEKGEIPGFKKMGFKIGYVFDISQTDFPVEKYPELFYMGYQSEQHLAICHAIETYSRQLPRPIEVGACNCPVV